MGVYKKYKIFCRNFEHELKVSSLMSQTHIMKAFKWMKMFMVGLRSRDTPTEVCVIHVRHPLSFDQLCELEVVHQPLLSSRMYLWKGRAMLGKYALV